MPGKKKKKKMTPEEKRLWEEKKRLEEEEAKKKKEELVAMLLKDRIASEEKASAFSHDKLIHQWRQMMRSAKTESLKKDIEVLSQTFERVTDRRDAFVKGLLQSLAESDEQYAMAFRSHLQNIDYLIALQKSRLQALEDDFQLEQETIREEFDTEKAMLCDMHQKEMNDQADILFALEEIFQERENDAKSDFQSLRDELKNKMLEDKHALRMNLEQKVDDLWQQFRHALQNYNDTTEERKTAFEALRHKDEKSALEIELQMRKLQRISDLISLIKSKLVTNARESEENNKYLREEREKIQLRFRAVKKQVNEVRAREREKLTKMTLESNAAIKVLRRKKKKGEQILLLAQICRKMETEEEKVVPFYASSLSAKQQQAVEEAVLEPPSEPLAAVMQDYSSLERFWQRCSKVNLERLALEKDRQGLQEQNLLLRRHLKNYLDGVSVNQEVLSKHNNLLVVNYKSQHTLTMAGKDPRVRLFLPEPKILIEARDVVKNIVP